MNCSTSPSSSIRGSIVLSGVVTGVTIAHSFVVKLQPALVCHNGGMDDVPSPTLIHRETRTLVLLVMIAVAAFVVTRAVAHANQARRLRDAQAWFARGQDSLGGVDAASAVRQLRRAAALDPSSLPFRLELARALAADAPAEARRVLLDSRAAAPQNADVNLALGRL